jgi:large subunit ribosomal protein L11e
MADKPKKGEGKKEAPKGEKAEKPKQEKQEKPKADKPAGDKGDKGAGKGDNKAAEKPKQTPKKEAAAPKAEAEKPKAAAKPKPESKDDGKESKSDVMRQIYIEKVVVNICVGEAGDRLTRASRVLKELTEQNPVFSEARLTVRTFGIRRNEKIAVHATVRGPKAEEILDKGLQVKEYELRDRNFSSAGNFGFGIDEHIDLGIKYDPAVGIYGMDIFVVLGRPGFRVNKRKRGNSRIGLKHRITKEEAQKWFKTKFGGHIRVGDD